MGKSGEAAGRAGGLGAAGSGMLAVPAPAAGSPEPGGRLGAGMRLRLPGGDPGGDGAALGAKRPGARPGQFPGQPGSRGGRGAAGEGEGRRD